MATHSPKPITLTVTVGGVTFPVKVCRYPSRPGTMETPPEPEEYELRSAQIPEGEGVTEDDLTDSLYGEFQEACAAAYREGQVA